MRIMNLNHKINRKQKVKNHLAYLKGLYENPFINKIILEGEVIVLDFAEEKERAREQEEMYTELVATPVGGETPYYILV